MRTFSSSRYLEELMAELDRAAISARLAESRETAGLSQADMAELLTVHVNTIQNWESLRKPTIPFDRLDEWGALTNTSKAWLLHGGDLATEPVEAEVAARLLAVEEALQELRRELLLRLPDAQGEQGEGSSG